MIVRLLDGLNGIHGLNNFETTPGSRSPSSGYQQQLVSHRRVVSPILSYFVPHEAGLVVEAPLTNQVGCLLEFGSGTPQEDRGVSGGKVSHIFSKLDQFLESHRRIVV